MTEAEVLKKVLKKLQFLEVTGDVLWHRRCHSGQFGKIRVGKAGDPDVMALVNNRDGTISVLFIEVKRTGIRKLRYEQKIFFESMEGKPKILCIIINNPNQLWSGIKKARDL